MEKKRKLDQPWSYNEEEKLVIFELFSENNQKEWNNKYVFFNAIAYDLGGIWINFGNFLKKLIKEEKPIEIVQFVNPEKNIIIFLSWLTKVILGPEVIVDLKDVAKSRTRYQVGKIDEFINEDKIINSINDLTVRELRELTEIFATTHIIIADALYQIDFGSTLADTPYAEVLEETSSGRMMVKNKVSTWQAYGRYPLRKFRQKVITDFVKEKEECLLIPCTLTKPYYGNLENITESTTKSNLIKKDIAEGTRDVVVMTTIGIVPQKYWLDPVDLGYDVRVPDLYSDFTSMKSFFMKNKYEVVRSWLNYPPYIEMLIILEIMGIVKKVEWMVDPNMTIKKGNYGAFFAPKQSEMKYEDRIKREKE